MELIVELQHSSILLLFFATEMKRIENVFVEESKLHEWIILIDTQFAALSRHKLFSVQTYAEILLSDLN